MSQEFHCFSHFFFIDITHLFRNIFMLLTIAHYSVAYIFKTLTGYSSYVCSTVVYKV